MKHVKQNNSAKYSDDELASRETISEAPISGQESFKRGHVEKSGLTEGDAGTTGEKTSNQTQKRAQELREFVNDSEPSEVYRTDGGRDERTTRDH